MRPEMRTHRRLAALATRQHGIVSARQLHRLGYSPEAVKRAVRAGRLHPVHRGVYAVGHELLTRHGRCLAAVAACGPRALLSHASAIWLWGLSPYYPAEVDVSVPHRGHRRSEVRVHFSPALSEEDRAKHEGIPVTTVSRTLLDFAATSPSTRVERAVRTAERRSLLDLCTIEALLARVRRHPGTRNLRAALAAYHSPAFTRSELEQRFLALVREAGCPHLPRTSSSRDTSWTPSGSGSGSRSNSTLMNSTEATSPSRRTDCARRT